MLEDRAEERAPRNQNGILVSEATDPRNENAFEVPLPLTDFASRALAAAKKKYADRWGEAALESLLWRVQKSD